MRRSAGSGPGAAGAASAMPWRSVGIGSTALALFLLALQLSAGLLTVSAFPDPGAGALRARLMLPVSCATVLLVAVATLAAIRRLQLKPDRARFRIRDLSSFALVCAALVLLPSEALLVRWAAQPEFQVGYAWPLIQAVQLLSLLITIALVFRGLRESWYAD